MDEKSKALTLTELIDAVIPYLDGKGYTERYVEDIRRVYRHLREYCGQNGISHFTAAVGQRFLRDRYGVALGVKTNRSEVRRAINMLCDYQQFGVILRRTAEKLAYPVNFARPILAHVAILRESGLSEGTVRNTELSLKRLTQYLDSQGVTSVSAITLDHLNGYTKTAMCHFCKQRVAHELRVTRRLMDFLYGNGYHRESLSGKIMKVHKATEVKHIPSAFKQEEVKRMLDSVDRQSPCGKRDYALLLFVAKLGMRADDVRRLRFEQIDWDKNTVSLTQGKTKEPNILTLPADAGWALIDYIQHGRPATEARVVFVRQVAPHVMQKSFNNIILKYLRMAKITIPKGKLHGMHSLRHSLATTLLEQNEPIHVIQGILGHLDVNTTKRYTAVDVDQLRSCALEVPHEEA